MSYKDLINKARLCTTIAVSDESMLFFKDAPLRLLNNLRKNFYKNLSIMLDDRVRVSIQQDNEACIREYSVEAYVFSPKELKELLETYLEEKITIIKVEPVEVKLIEHQPL